MSAPHGSHLSGSDLEALAAGEATREQAARLDAHLQTCAACRKELDAIKRENSFFRTELGGVPAIPAVDAPDAAPAPVPLSAARSGHYWWLGAAALVMVSLGAAYPLLISPAARSDAQTAGQARENAVSSAGTDPALDGAAADVTVAGGPGEDAPPPPPPTPDGDKGERRRPPPHHPPGPPGPPGPPPPHPPMGADMADGMPPPPPHHFPPPPHHRMGKDGMPPPPPPHRMGERGEQGGPGEGERSRQGPPPPRRAGKDDPRDGPGEDAPDGERPPPPPPPRPRPHLPSHGQKVGEIRTAPAAIPAGAGQGHKDVTYEGKTAKQWLEQIENRWDVEKATHALTLIGADAVPALLEQLRGGDEEFVNRVKQVLAGLKPNPTNKARYIRLLSDNHFEVRRMAVKLLEPMVLNDRGVEDAIRGALKDRDMAVVEAAEKALAPVHARDEKTKELTGNLMNAAQEAMQKQEFDKALKLYREVMHKDPTHVEARASAQYAHDQLLLRKTRQAEEKTKDAQAKEPAVTPAP